MSARAKEFLDEWVEGVAATGKAPSNDVEAHSFKENLIDDASGDGISPEELEAAANGDLLGHLQRVLGRDDDDE